MPAPPQDTAAAWWRTEEGWLAFLGVVPVLPHALFHLMEQWTAFGGRAAWLGRMRVTSAGFLAGAVELLVVVGYVAWAVLLVRALLARRAPPGSGSDHESALSRTLASVARPAALLTASLGLVHIATLFLPRFLGMNSLALGYETLRMAAGRPAGLSLMAFGISAFVLHTAASIPNFLIWLGYGDTRENRQAGRLVGVGLSACLLVLFAQLAGWHATGTGTVWPITVIEVGDEPIAIDD